MPDNFNISDVMISYSRKDKDFIRQIDQALRANGYEVWVDWEDIPPTADWWNEIQAGIEAANAFIFVISPDSVQSNVCRRELEHALAHHKRLLPVLYRSVSEPEVEAQMHPALRQHNWISLREGENFEQSVQNLIQAMATDLTHVRLHTRLLVRAREWEAAKRKNGFLLRGDDLREAERWLRDSASRTPVPTPLQARYIQASRRAANRFRQIVAGGLLTALVILSLLTLRLFAETQNTQVALATAQQALTNVAMGEWGLSTAIADAIEEADARATQAKLALDSAATARVAEGVAQAEADNAATQAQAAQENAATATVARGQAQIEAANARRQAGIAQENAVTATIAQGAAQNNATSAAYARQTAEAEAATAIAASKRAQALQLVRLSNEALAAGDRVTALQRALLAYQLQPDLAEVQAALVGVSFQPGQTYQFSVEGNLQNVRFGNNCGSTSLTATEQEWKIGNNACVIVTTSTDTFTTEQGGGGKTLTSPNNRQVFYFDTFTLDNTQNDTVANRVLNHGTTVQLISAAFSPNSARLATGGNDGNVYLWDVGTGERLDRFRGHTGQVTHLAFSADGNQLVSAATDGSIRVWDLKTLAAIDTRLDAERDVRRALFAISPDCQYFLSWDVRQQRGASTEDNTRIILWKYDPPGGALWQECSALDVPFIYGGFSPNSQWIVYATSNNIYLHKIGSPDPNPPSGSQNITNCNSDTAVSNTFGGVSTLAFSPNGQYLGVIQQNNTVALWSLNTQPITKREFTPDGAGGGVKQLYFSGDNQSIFLVREDNQIESWDVATLQRTNASLDTMIPDTPLIYLNADEFFNGETSGLVRLRDEATNNTIRSFLGQSERIKELVLSSDKRLLASIAVNRRVMVWDVATGQAIFSALAPEELSNLQFKNEQTTQYLYAFTNDKGYLSRLYYWILPDSTFDDYKTLVNGICSSNGVPPLSEEDADSIKNIKDVTTQLCPSTPTPTPEPDDRDRGGGVSVPVASAIDVDSAQLTQSPGWTERSNAGAGGGMYLVNTVLDSSATLSLTFEGTGIEIVYVSDATFGSFTLWIDGAMKQAVNSAASSLTFGGSVIIDGLPDGEHRLEIIPLAAQIGIDGFRIQTAAPTATPETTLELTAEVTEVATVEATEEAVAALVSESAWALTSEGWYISEGAYTNILDLSTTVDMTDNQPRWLTFESLLNVVELGGSTATVQVRSDGQNWILLDTIVPSIGWTEQMVDLSAYLGQNIQVRFVWFYVPPAPDTIPDSWIINNVEVSLALPATETPTATIEPPTVTPTATPEPPTATMTATIELPPTATPEPPTVTAPTESPIDPPVTFLAPAVPPIAADMNTGGADWVAGGSWYLAETEAGDFGWYSQANRGGILTWRQPIDLRNAQNAQLTFDFYFRSQAASATLEISTDGAGWSPLYSTGIRVIRVTETVNLAAYSGQVIYLRFVWSGDNLDSGAFWLIDNLQVTAEGLPIPTPEVTSAVDVPESTETVSDPLVVTETPSIAEPVLPETNTPEIIPTDVPPAPPSAPEASAEVPVG